MINLKHIRAIAGIAGAALLYASGASATTLTSKISVDNGFIAYISTSNNIAGTQFQSFADWGTTSVAAVNLVNGVDYYLHIAAYDFTDGGVAAFLGEFSLNSNKHKFANNLLSMTTNTTNWQGNTTGFGSAYGAVSLQGTDGDQPWGNRPQIANTANWIWVGNATSNDVAYFSTKITAVPEPGSMALFGLGLAGLAALRRKKAAR